MVGYLEPWKQSQSITETKSFPIRDGHSIYRAGLEKFEENQESQLLVSLKGLLGAFPPHNVRIPSHPHLNLEFMADSSSKPSNPSSAGFSTRLRGVHALGDIEMQDSLAKAGGGSQGKQFTAHLAEYILRWRREGLTHPSTARYRRSQKRDRRH